MITADKTFLRSHYKKKRFSLTKQEVDDLSQRVCKQLDKLNIWKLKHYHIFISILKYNGMKSSTCYITEERMNRLIMINEFFEFHSIDMYIDNQFKIPLQDNLFNV